MNQYKRSYAQWLRDELEDAIINGQYRPGDRLDPDALAEQYQVSRTPIREAIQQLEVNGLVRVVPKRGTFIAEIGLAQLIEMFEVMAELEGMCGRLASRRITAEETAALKAALSACGTAAEGGDADSYYYENEYFHYLIYDASHNNYLASEAKHLHARLKVYRRLQLRVRNRVSRSYREHEAIVDAIVAGDERRAEQNLKAHILVQGERFTDLVSSMDERWWGHREGVDGPSRSARSSTSK